MNLLIVLVILLLVFGGLPQISGNWHGMGWGPSGLGLVLVIVLVVLLLTGRL